MKLNTKQNIKGYKVFNQDWSCSCIFKSYFKQYACPGIFEEDVVPEVCEKGMHFCEKLDDCFAYYDFNPRNKVAEVIALGYVDTNGKKSCTNKLQIVRELSWDEVLNLVNDGKGNTGRYNIGNYNSGNRNKGDYNSGWDNEGDYNSGCNNEGDYNSGDWNTGNCNSGRENVGNYNSGNRNKGDYNNGNWNEGNHNTGDWNEGNWNKSSHTYGCFNTKHVFESYVFSMFNKETNWNLDDWRQSEACQILENMPQSRLTWICFGNMTDKEKLRHTYAETTGGYLRMTKANNRQQWWNTLPESDKKEIMSLPNFDADIFFKITGIKINNIRV